ncbi:MAG TPA: hypothetical protein VK508_14315 [Cyclobacteriaceae bacterium]|nr:hypothetical protein [Cyclobacteriaceae bacterium]
MRGIFICFGFLDLLAFYRSFPVLNRIFENYDVSALIPNVLPAITVLLVLSLLVTGPLTIVGNRYGYVIYYFQFPLRLAFRAGLTFGFVFRLLPAQVGTFAYGMTLATILAFEATRLMLTIQAHRKNT